MELEVSAPSKEEFDDDMDIVVSQKELWCIKLKNIVKNWMIKKVNDLDTRLKKFLALNTEPRSVSVDSGMLRCNHIFQKN